eukprot:gene12737-47_t
MPQGLRREKKCAGYPASGPCARATAACDRAPPISTQGSDGPWVVLVGGGMGSGKSCIRSLAFVAGDGWDQRMLGASHIDADAFKATHPVQLLPVPCLSEVQPAKHAALVPGQVYIEAKAKYEAAIAAGADDYQWPDLSPASLQAAEDLLLESLGQSRDIIFEGTMSWLPYILQTFEMIRCATAMELFFITVDCNLNCALLFKTALRFADSSLFTVATTLQRGSPTALLKVLLPYVALGNPGMSVIVMYWCDVCSMVTELLRKYWLAGKARACPGPAYSVRLLGVMCNPQVAVKRAMERQDLIGRAVPFKEQLFSLQAFARNFSGYSQLSDEAILLDNSGTESDCIEQVGTVSIPVVARKVNGIELSVEDPKRYIHFHESLDWTPTDELPPSPDQGTVVTYAAQQTPAGWAPQQTFPNAVCLESKPAADRLWLPPLPSACAPMKGPSDISNWVVPYRLVVGGHPLTGNSPLTPKQRLKELVSAGVTTFVCLQSTAEYFACRPYINLARQLKGKHINFYHFPTTDHWVSSSDQVVLAVNFLTHLMSLGEVIYLHCTGGHGRAGVLASVIVGHLWNLVSDTALERVQ